MGPASVTMQAKPYPNSVLLMTWLLLSVALTSRACVGARLRNGSVVPVGSGVQDAAPAREKVPGKQPVHPLAPTVPAPVTVPAYIGAQIVHELTEVLPDCEPLVKMPVGHGVHDRELAEAA